ncbi:hypothetical protein BRD56_00085 [Thermoplasmatales archaeon SW_10_69_26]|jgi:hypothetical protein|nr:MAG: hypothetical protein BRD56_00085 [Thermoplasmatales archaeon SW_10_69_26]
MELGLAERWWMGVLVALTGAGLLTLNVQSLGSAGDWTISVVSTASAACLAALGLALVFERQEENI